MTGTRSTVTPAADGGYRVSCECGTAWTTRYESDARVEAEDHVLEHIEHIRAERRRMGGTVAIRVA